LNVHRPILFISNCAWNLANFRRPLIEAFVTRGDRVACAASADGHETLLRDLGAEFFDLPVDAGGTSPIADLRLMNAMDRLMRSVRPAALLTFTIKPNIYGPLVARVRGVPAIPTVSGLGSSFLGGGLTGFITNRLYRLSFAGARTVIFQNDDDRSLFISRGLVEPVRTRVVPGSGIDLDRFRPAPLPPRGPVSFLLIARLLRDKGLVEYAEAARILINEGLDVRCAVLGPEGGSNPSAVPKGQVERWIRNGTIDYLGPTDDVRGAIAKADCVVLPSYREGLPRSLLEAAAMARPVIATDVPGCRDVVAHGVNGLLCAPRSASALAAAMRQMASLNRDERLAMGEAGRCKVEAGFDQRGVAATYLAEVGR
jgi:glycosyltransferase involved in cell wall biosynthesis